MLEFLVPYIRTAVHTRSVTRNNIVIYMLFPRV